MTGHCSKWYLGEQLLKTNVGTASSGTWGQLAESCGDVARS